MPTNQIYWNGTDDSSYASLVADLTIFASTNPKYANEAFNIVNGDYFCWKYIWLRVAAYFGAKASSDQKFEKPFPTPGVPQLELSFAEWAKDKRPAWDRICDKAGVPQAKPTWDAGTWAYQDWGVPTYRVCDTEYQQSPEVRPGGSHGLVRGVRKDL
jgi:hypothetical protein